MTSEADMVDVQNQPGVNDIDIDMVGVCDLSYPIEVLDRKENRQSTTARVNMYVNLPNRFKGTHMSRFIEILNRYRGEITFRNMGEILKQMIKSLEAQSARMELAFEYFIEKSAPVSHSKSLMGYGCRFVGRYAESTGEDFILEVSVPVMILCPCSKEISAAAAHNQRSKVTVQLRFTEFVWIEDIVEMVEKAASSELYAMLKRPDEKYVVDKAYDNPRFVEDIVRLVAQQLMADKKVVWFSVSAKSFESIHNHNAYARVERDKRK